MLWSSLNLLPKPLPVMFYLRGVMAPCGPSLTMASRVKKQFGKNPDVDALNRVPGMAQTPCWVSPLEDFFSTPADPSKLYWMCPPYHRFSDCVRKIRQEKLRAIVVGPRWTHREWWKPLMEITLQGYHLPGPDCLYQNDRLTPLPQQGLSTVALYVDGGIAEQNLAATKCHVASVLALAVSNPNMDGEPGMTSEEESEDERVPNHLVSVLHATKGERRNYIRTLIPNSLSNALREIPPDTPYFQHLQIIKTAFKYRRRRLKTALQETQTWLRQNPINDLHLLQPDSADNAWNNQYSIHSTSSHNPTLLTYRKRTNTTVANKHPHKHRHVHSKNKRAKSQLLNLP